MDRYTIKDFNREFPDDAACLEWLRNRLYPDGIHCKLCQKVTKHHRVTSRPSYSCDTCGHHVHPTAGTIFHKSSTSLRTWFHAIFRMASTRCGISAKTIERETGVTYKTAWRMFRQIRSMLSEGVNPLTGAVEADETYVGGKAPGKTGRGASNKTIVAGVVQRRGRVRAKVVPNAATRTLIPLIRENVSRDATVYTDDFRSYRSLWHYGFRHRTIAHSQRVYVTGDIHTNTIESFWSLFKRSIDGSHHQVSPKYLQTYVNEYTFRWNHRLDDAPMFQTMLRQVRKG